MTLTSISTLQARPGKEPQVRAQALSLIDPSLSEPGCLSYQPYQHPTDPSRWVVIESWSTRAAFEAHLRSPHLQEAFEAGAELLTGPPQEQLFELPDALGPQSVREAIEEEGAQVLDSRGNYYLTKRETRRFPALSIQGDSLHILRKDLEEAESELSGGSVEDALFSLREVLETVVGMDLSYQEMMENQGLKLPYFDSGDTGADR
ncbi:putative quinol monooxygenase [Nocardia concava]|uniref:putative quinol monooxygenase n=1 Tax=Nocardia concava TaxID=257281 RepID=UPI0003078D8B|nr:putative quinol monooxygenase [Nocardia concava]